MANSQRHIPGYKRAVAVSSSRAQSRTAQSDRRPCPKRSYCAAAGPSSGPREPADCRSSHFNSIRPSPNGVCVCVCVCCGPATPWDTTAAAAAGRNGAGRRWPSVVAKSAGTVGINLITDWPVAAVSRQAGGERCQPSCTWLDAASDLYLPMYTCA